jgi:hypothetical protein
MIRTSDVDPKDYKYIVAQPDASFSPQRNKQIVLETMQETDKFFRDMREAVDDNLGNRIDILSSYGRYRFNRGTKSFEEYAGRELATRLIGEKILSKVKIFDSVNKIKSKTKPILL